jgi:hypothetical protein
VESKVFTDNQLLTLLPSERKDILAASLSRRLIEVERFFGLDLSSFLENERFSEADYFSYNSGAVQLRFEGNLTHSLAVYGEQLSIVVLPESLSSDGFAELYQLSEVNSAPLVLRDCLGRICQDVRIWTLQEEFESEEAKEVALSYVLSGDLELFYCIYLHGDLDSDYLLLGQDVPREKVANCFSVALGEYIDPKR